MQTVKIVDSHVLGRFRRLSYAGDKNKVFPVKIHLAYRFIHGIQYCKITAPGAPRSILFHL
jgi:hypothetical protein